MKTNPTPSSEKAFACETCTMRKKAEANPKTLGYFGKLTQQPIRR